MKDEINFILSNSEEELAKNLHKLSLVNIIKYKEKLTLKFITKYILNEKYYGLTEEHDIDILNKDNVTSRFGYSSFRLLVNLSNPELKFADTQFHYYPILEEGNNCEREFEYEREIELINFKSKDWYCYNDNKIYLSRQKLNPFDNEMTLEFHYKY